MDPTIESVVGCPETRVASVPTAVAAFLVAGALALAAVSGLLVLTQSRAATRQAIHDARTLTALKASDVLSPVLTDASLGPGPGRVALDRAVRRRVLGPSIVRVKIWDASGRIVFSDDRSLIGLHFPLEQAQQRALLTSRSAAHLSELEGAENRDERQFGKLLEVYLGVKTSSGQRLLFETYQPYRVIADASRRRWIASLPAILSGLLLLYLVQAPLAYRMARRLRRSQDEREALLLASLAASDRERTVIAADLHDGIVQTLAGASMFLSAASQRAAATNRDAAMAMATTAADLRRCVRELRSLVVTITPPALHDQGLARSLTDLVATLEMRGLHVEVDIAVNDPLPEATETLIYRAAQEAIRNIVRHAKAMAVTLTLELAWTNDDRHRTDVRLRVLDDGQGFDVAQSPPRASVGLQLLGQLVAGQGGTMTIDGGRNGQGTCLIVRLPLPAKPASVSPVAAPLQRDPVRHDTVIPARSSRP